MMKLLISFAIALVTAAGIAAQQSSSTPPPATPPSSTPAPQTTQVSPQPTSARSADLRRIQQQQFPLNPVSESDRLSARVTRLAYLIAPLYKRPSGKDLAAILPSKAIEQKYAEFLQLESVGLVKLVRDSGCVFSDRVVSVREECLKYSFPGAGNSFSFRTEGYRLRHLADVTYVDDKLRMTGIFMHSIAVDLGNVPIETASLETRGMRFLTGFEPSTLADDVLVVDQRLSRGIRSDNFVYSKEIDPMADRTYAIRAVAYRGKVVRAAAGIRYNELEYDKRRDVIVVFRVVEMNAEGVTILWRKLADIEAPKIKMPKTEKEDEKRDGDEAN